MQRLVPPDHINQSLSGGLGEVVETMMAKDRNDRYASPKDLSIDLRRLLQGQPPLLAKRHLKQTVMADLEEGEEADDDRTMARKLQSRTSLALLLAVLLAVSVLLNLVLLLAGG